MSLAERIDALTAELTGPFKRRLYEARLHRVTEDTTLELARVRIGEMRDVRRDLRAIA